MSTTTSRGFVHLHTHVEYSPLDGMARIADAVAAAAADGQPAIAETDHGTLAGAWKLRALAAKHGIKAIPGIEAYMAIGTRHDPQIIEVPADEESGDAIDDDKGTVGATGEMRMKRKVYEHLTILATSQEGWRNLVRMHNSAQQTYSPSGRGLAKPQPLMDFALLEQHRQGLIVLTGCIGGGVAGALARGDRPAAERYLDELVRIMGTDNVFVEVMDHGIPAQRTIAPALRELAQQFGVGLVATNDAHYARADQQDAHEAWLAVGTKATLAQENRFKFHGTGHHLRTEAEMRALFDGEDWWQQACDNTVAIADRVADDVFGPTRQRLPVYDVATLHPDYEPSATVDRSDPRAMSNAYFRYLVSLGARERLGLTSDAKLPPEVNARISWEYKVITDQGFADYFLIVRDVIEWCRSTRGLPTKAHPRGRDGQKKPIRVGPGRGSAAGSFCSYALRIVGPDPIKNGLLFERFLDPERAGMPDIDVDFEQGRRGEVLAYLSRRWGADKVAQIGTFGMARTKAAIKDAARVLGMTPLGEKLSKLVPVEGGKPVAIAVLEDPENRAGADFRAAVARGGADAVRIIDLAKSFEDVIKTPGVHACGVLISDEPLHDLVPLRANRSKSAGPNAPMVTEWDGNDVADYGLLKLDVLGLRNLDVVSLAVDYIAERTGEVVDPDEVDPDHDDARAQATWALLRAGKTPGVFQMESEGMTKLAQDAGPDSLDDLSTIVALYRPGPLGQGMHHHWAARKRGTEAVDYSIFTDDPAEQAAIATVLDESMAVPVFQEQSMRLGEAVAGFGPGEKNRLRKAISKKKEAEIAAIGELWAAGAGKEIRDEDGNVTKIAFSKRTADRVWDAIKESGRYQFNKCLSGDTTVETGRHTTWTIADLHRRLHENERRADGMCAACVQRPSRAGSPICGACAQWRRMVRGKRGLHVLAYDFADGRIRPKRVKDVHDNGVREVLLITLADGKALRATPNHRLMSGGRWVLAGDLSAGDSLTTSAGYEAPVWDGGYRLTQGERQGAPGRLYAPGEQNIGYVDGGHVALKAWTAQTAPTAACGVCGTSEGRLERAHLDGNRRNNTSENLRWLCVSHHKPHGYEHNGRRRKWGKGYATAEAEVVSVVPDGQVRTYDLEMDDEGHNFVANGIVSHNSHSTAYGQIAFMTAWLKANWPAEFAAAILATTKKNPDKRLAAIMAMRAEGIELLPPDCNLSMEDTAPEGDNVRLGLSEVRGVGANAAAIIAARESGGPFTGLADLLARVHAAPKSADTDEADDEQADEQEAGAALPVNVVEQLIEAGAMDAFGPRLGQFMVVRALREHPELAVPDVEWGLLERSGRQRVAIGVVTGEHPLSVLGEQLRGYRAPNKQTVRSVASIDTAPERGRVTVLGVLAGYGEKAYSKGRMARIAVEGTNASAEGVMWDDDRTRIDFEPTVGQVVAISGDVRLREVEVENEEGELETIERRELTIRDMWLVPVQDPATDRFHVTVDPIHVDPQRVVTPPLALVQAGVEVPLQAYQVSLPDPVVMSLGDLLPNAPWLSEPQQGVWVAGSGSDAVVVQVGKATTALLNHARTVAIDNEQPGWVAVAAAP